MKEGDLEAYYRRLMAHRARDDRETCVAPEDLLRLAQRSGGESERVRLFNHVMACEACRREYEMLLAAVELKPARRKLNTGALAAAAAVALIMGAGLIWQSVNIEPDGDVLRGPEEALTLVAPPPGRVASRDPTFTWRATEGASEYHFELLDPAGSPVFAVATEDTLLALPDSVDLRSDWAYSWWIRAVLTDGTVRTSSMRRLQVP